MDSSSPTTLAESDSTGTCMNGSSMRRPSPGPFSSPSGRPASLLDHNQGQAHVVRVVVNKDERGYGMKVSGDNPVYVQSVKDGGAAEKAGLHAGDKIIKVNGVNVMQSTHTQVVALIKSSSQVVLTVQQRTSALRMGSPSLHNRPVTTPTSSRITGPQPVDNEKQYQLQLEKEQYYRLMIEKEQNYIDLLRSQIASSPDEKKYLELAKTEKNLQTLQAMLMRSQNEQQSPAALDSPLSLPKSLSFPSPSSSLSPNGNSDATSPPPLPKRNGPQHHHHHHTNNLNGKTPYYHINERHEINANTKTERKRRLMSEQPPPLPPRPATLSTPPPLPAPPSASSTTDPDAVNSINKQMSYPLVATCTPLVNDYSPNQSHHHRTKSSPEQLLSMVDANGKKLSESMNDLTGGRGTWESPETPPGTPPPPYPSPRPVRREGVGGHDESDHLTDECFLESPELAGFRGMPRVLANSSPIHAATPSTTQQPIISMEDDDVSDQESNQLEDHGHFKSLARLWEHLPHLAVFMNYILSNSDPNSLMFYLLTDLYKEGNAKEMRKWAFEIHSCFLVPGAPLRLGNVDENIAREIDVVLTKEYDKEEILRKIFWKARSRAKEELTRQLVEFQHRRTAGLGTIFGPTDQILSEVYNDKAKEIKLYESLFLEKLEPYLEEVEKENYDSRRYYTAAALATVLTRIFQIRPTLHALDRCPTFVNKEKSFRTKFIGKYSRKLNVLGHQFVAQQYYTVIMCNNCHQILYGIGPQGYQCSACLINLHRHCVKQFEDTCPGPIMKKDRGIMKLIGMRHDNTDHSRIRKSSQFLQMERERRQLEERDNSFDLNENDSKQSQPVSRSGSDRRPDSVREEGASKHQDAVSGGPGGGGGGGGDVHGDAVSEKTETASPESSTILPAVEKSRRANSNINRSESVKEQSEKRKQRRNISDPSHNTTSSVVDLDRHPGLSNTDSGSSSNSSISCNGRLSESPSNSVDAVGQSGPVRTNLDSDSDLDAETDSWQHLVPLEEFKNLSVHEKKRQDVINEFFHTESSHVRNLKVLYKIFYKKIQDSQTLKPDELSLIFPNIKEMLDIHTEISREMRRRRKEDPLVREIGEMLMKVFEDRQGEALKKAAATFCERQQLALEFIKRRRERDSKFDSVLSECEKKRQCRRLPFQGILPTEMQRLSKYPLLLERLIGSIESGDKDASGERSQHQQEELTKLRRAHHMSKEILNYVNEAAKVAHNKHRLEEIQKHLDTSSFERSESPIAQEFRTLDLTKYRLIIEGGMQLRRPNKGVVPVHILLLEEAVVILHREGDKFLLKFFQSGSLAQPLPLSPIIRMNTLLVRTNAVCKNALFLVNMSTNNSQMYDLIAEDEIKREVWFKHFSDATESYKRREGKSGVAQTPPEDDSDTESVQELPPPTEVTAGRAEAVGGKEENATSSTSVEEEEEDSSAAAPDEESRKVSERSEEEEEAEKREGGGVTRESTASPEMVAGGGNLVESSKVSAEEWPLIQPSQVNVAVPPVHTAESMLTPLEQIRRKDALVKQALEDKEGLVADMLSIPREHFQHIADMATVDTSTSREPSERVLASIFQVDQLQKAINRSLNVSEKDVLVAKGGKHPACASQAEPTEEEEESTVPLTIPVSLVRDVANSLSSQLTTLLSEVKQMEEERDRLRKELHNVRERLHEEHNLHSAVPTEDVETDCASQVDTSLNDSLQMISKSDCEEEQ